MKVYGYARISRKTQNIERQIKNIYSVNPEALIYQEAFTGTKIERPEFNKLLKIVKKDDTIIFDSISRMSRNAEEGIELYERLFNEGINLIFIKEPYINTKTYKEALEKKIDLTSDEITNLYIQATNEALKLIARNQIKIAFNQAQKEVDDLHQRTKEGMEIAKASGKQIGRTEGKTYETKKAKLIKEEILKKSFLFNGNLTDNDLIKILQINRNTYYKYKKELKEEWEA